MAAQRAIDFSIEAGGERGRRFGAWRPEQAGLEPHSDLSTTRSGCARSARVESGPAPRTSLASAFLAAGILAGCVGAPVSGDGGERAGLLDSNPPDGGAVPSDGRVADGGSDGWAPSDPQLLQIDDLEYAGAFRVPADMFGISELNFAAGPIEVSPVRGSIYLVGHAYQQAIAEFPMPGLVMSEVLSDLRMAGPPIQTFASVLDRASTGNPQALDRIEAIRFFDGPSGPELFVNAREFYDAAGDNTHTTLVVRNPGELATSTIDGFFSLEGAAHASGWMSSIPPEWRARLGGTAITGSSSGIPIISRLSVGPSAFTFDPRAVRGATGAPGPVATEALLDYDLATPLHEDLSNDSGTNALWTHLSRAVYGMIVPGTRSYMTLGYSGGHAATGVCYKCIPAGETEECPGYCSRDPSDYSLYYWFFDVNDLVAVREGRMAPHEPRPYAYGAFRAPFETNEIGGGAYDPATGLLYLTMLAADREQGEFANPPVIVAFRIRAPG